jgi:hypothetical protein
VVGLAVFLVACARSGHAPASPDHATTATTVGLLARWDFVGCGLARFELKGGQVIEQPIHDCTTGSYQRDMLGGSIGVAEAKTPLAHGPLMLFGEDDLGRWYATAPDDQRDGSCYRASGGAFREGETLHFPSGLVVPIARPLKVWPEGDEDTFPLWSGDWMCFDRTGTVVSVTSMPEL